jgi:hypothetical protein
MAPCQHTAVTWVTPKARAAPLCSPPCTPLPIGTRESELLRMLVMGFQVAYGHEDEIEVKKKEAAN